MVVVYLLQKDQITHQFWGTVIMAEWFHAKKQRSKDANAQKALPERYSAS